MLRDRGVILLRCGGVLTPRLRGGVWWRVHGRARARGQGRGARRDLVVEDGDGGGVVEEVVGHEALGRGEAVLGVGEERVAVVRVEGEGLFDEVGGEVDVVLRARRGRRLSETGGCRPGARTCSTVTMSPEARTKPVLKALAMPKRVWG